MRNELPSPFELGLNLVDPDIDVERELFIAKIHEIYDDLTEEQIERIIEEGGGMYEPDEYEDISEEELGDLLFSGFMMQDEYTRDEYISEIIG